MVGGNVGVMMEKTGGDKLLAKNSQQSDLYNYNLDHVYCSDGNSRYRTTTTAGATHLNLAAAAADLKSLRKENKQLQAMLLLHLDLIQEQSNQLIAKDKQLLQLREENAQLRLKCERTSSVAAVTTTTSTTTAAAAERRQNNNRYTVSQHSSVGSKLLNTSGGSPTIDSYFTTAAESKVSTNRLQQQQPHHDGKFKQNFITINQNALINSNSSDENQAINEIRNPNQMTIPIKVEVNTTTIDDPQSQSMKVMNVFSDTMTTTTTTTAATLAMAKDQRFKSHSRAHILTPTTITAGHDKPITTVKYRTVDNSIIGNNNGKLISKIILQRKKSENGEKIFVRTKNIDLGNNKVSYEKWSPLRQIKNEVIECSEMEAESIVLEATATATANTTTKIESIASPTSNTMAAIHDDGNSSDAMEASYLTTTSADMSPPPSVKTTPTTIIDNSDLSTDCPIDNIKIEQELDDDMQDEDEDEDDEHLPDSPVYDPNSTLDDSQDTLNVESSLTSDLPPLLTASATNPSSPITSTVSTSDFNQSEICMDTNSMTMSTTMATTTTAGSTILYPLSRRHINRNAFLTTKKPYKIREWQLDEIEAELKQEITDEVCKEENEANLELPKWRTWEMSSNREAPVREWEDLSDDTFVRRHARFLLDERKRKKWDVQRIREQRTIERLKRRHCKDELQNQQKDFNEVVTTFFPTVDQLKSIHITDDLPVSAFGESIPALPPAEFSLPWQIGQSLDSIPKSSEFLNAPAITANPINSRSNSICSSASINEPPTPSNVSSIIFLATKKRAGRTRTSTITSASYTLPQNSKTSTT
ncbi:protein male-specific lethal-1 [Sitodiplosis mosellana]|uniref:protein male-specific lethal-1 n=1 Tax=Sitodiplosis mosellana TaxID=263140 RepID=UPI002444D97A|nr:protein male-specific lethal-1 [Sitodiplosis mosellana]